MRLRKIINIMFRAPAYDLFWNDVRPEISWNTPDGYWFGIWGLDWADLIGREVLKLTNEFKYEVWQPDLRVDRIYAHTFPNGLTHKLFPAVLERRLFGYKLVSKIHSKTLIEELIQQIKKDRIILHLNGVPLLHKTLHAFLENIGIVATYHGIIDLPSIRLFSYTRNLPSKLNHLMEHIRLTKIVNKIDCITYQNDTNLDQLRKLYSGSLLKVTMGCDFSFWQSHDRAVARKKLGLPINKKIFLSASLLTSLKQIDRLIAVFTQLGNTYDFLLIIAGHGLKEYEEYLRNVSVDLLGKNKVQFTGHLVGTELLYYYNACDYFVSTSRQEGGPVSVMQACACEIPVLLTKTGHTAELMEQFNCGCLFDVHDYEMWSNCIEEILQGRKVVKCIDREVAKKYYDWPNVARKFTTIYEKLAEKYHA